MYLEALLLALGAGEVAGDGLVLRLRLLHLRVVYATFLVPRIVRHLQNRRVACVTLGVCMLQYKTTGKRKRRRRRRIAVTSQIHIIQSKREIEREKRTDAAADAYALLDDVLGEAADDDLLHSCSLVSKSRLKNADMTIQKGEGLTKGACTRLQHKVDITKDLGAVVVYGDLCEK